LHRRDRTGDGCFVDLAQFEAMVSQLGPAVLNYTENGEVPERTGNRSPYACPHGAFRCAGEDSWCAIAVETDDQWRTLCDVMGRSDLASHPVFATLQARKAHEDQVEAAVTGWTSLRDASEVMHCLQENGVPAGVVQGLREMLREDPQLKRHYTRVPNHHGPPFTVHRQPIRLGSYRAPTRPPPGMGEHTHRVLADLLGLSDGDFDNLVLAGALE